MSGRTALAPADVLGQQFTARLLKPLAVTIFNLQQAGDYNAASALALLVALAGIAGLSLTAAATARRPGA